MMPPKRTIRHWVHMYLSFEDALAYFQEVKECSLVEATNEWNGLPKIQLTKEGLPVDHILVREVVHTITSRDP